MIALKSSLNKVDGETKRKEYKPKVLKIGLHPKLDLQQVDREDQVGPSSLGDSGDGGSHGRAAIINYMFVIGILFIGEIGNEVLIW